MTPQPLQNKRPSAWLWGLVACNGLTVTAAHIAVGGQWQATWIGLFQMGAMLAHFTVLAALLALPPWVLLRLRAPRAASTALAILLLGTLCVVVIINAKVYALYKFHLNTMVWHLMTEGAVIETLSFSSQTWSGAMAIAVGIFIAEAGAARVLQRWIISTKLLRLYATLVIALGLVTQLVHAYADATAERNILLAVRGVPWAQPLTAKSFLARFGVKANDMQSPDLADQTPGVFNYPLTPMQCAAGATPNIVVIVVDSLRFDMLTADVMPATSAWALGATRFQHHYSTGNGTRFGIFGLLYGLPGGYWHAALAERRGPVLIDVLDDLGYQFFVFGSAPLDSPEFHRTAFTRIWDRLALPTPGNVVERDRATTRQLIVDIRDRDRARPFFGFLFLDAPHAYAHPPEMKSPFTPHLESINYLELDNDFDPMPFRNLYKTSVLFDDALVGAVLGAIADDDAAANTIVVVTGDHGQSFNETHDNTWGHNSDFSDYQVRVPFVVRWPGRAPDSVQRLTSHVDWVPTLLTDAFGCTTPIDRYSTGIPLFAENRTDRTLPIEQWTQRALRTNERVYVFGKWGGYEVHNERYTPIDESVNGPVIRSGFTDLSRFTRR